MMMMMAIWWVGKKNTQGQAGSLEEIPPEPPDGRNHSQKFLPIRNLVASGGGIIPEVNRDGRDHSRIFLLNPSGKRYHSRKFLLDRKLVAPGGGKNTGQAVYSADRGTNWP
jgi:hypothetical protein